MKFETGKKYRLISTESFVTPKVGMIVYVKGLEKPIENYPCYRGFVTTNLDLDEHYSDEDTGEFCLYFLNLENALEEIPE